MVGFHYPRGTFRKEQHICWNDAQLFRQPMDSVDMDCRLRFFVTIDMEDFKEL